MIIIYIFVNNIIDKITPKVYEDKYIKFFLGHPSKPKKKFFEGYGQGSMSKNLNIYLHIPILTKLFYMGHSGEHCSSVLQRTYPKRVGTHIVRPNLQKHTLIINNTKEETINVYICRGSLIQSTTKNSYDIKSWLFLVNIKKIVEKFNLNIYNK